MSAHSLDRPRAAHRPSAARHRVAVLASLLLFAAQPGPAAALEAGGIELEGTWYVLVHYRDLASAEPEADRWLDRVWRFERKGARLAWTEYSIVVFTDQTGRFEELSSSRASRVLTFWKPNQAQLREIRRGVEVNARGARSKTLRGSWTKGHTSTGSLRTESTSVIGYHETWTIDGPRERPVFARSDVMGSTGQGRTENVEGRTEFATEALLEGGSRLRGRYRRDGHQVGTFEMMRAGEVRAVGKQKSRREPDLWPGQP